MDSESDSDMQECVILQQKHGFCKIHQAGAHSNPGNTLGATSVETTRLVVPELGAIA